MIDTLHNRINRHIKRLYNNLKKDLQFSGGIARKRFAAEMLGYLHLNKASVFFWERLHPSIIQYILTQIPKTREKYCNVQVNCHYLEKAPIWVCWWQGLEEAPPVVKYCIDSIKKCSDNHPVYLITKENICDFIEIPKSICLRIEEKKIELANLADYIRCALICKYGGLWIDATVFVSKQIPKEYFQSEFYSISSERFQGQYISGGRWTTYVIGGWKNSKLFSFLKEAFEEYWEKNDLCIDYFLIDYLIDCAYKLYPDIRSNIDNVQNTNPNRYRLRDAMLKDASKEIIDNYIFDDTVFYKLSYKSLYGKYTSDGRETFYSTILKLYS